MKSYEHFAGFECPYCGKALDMDKVLDERDYDDGSAEGGMMWGEFYYLCPHCDEEMHISDVYTITSYELRRRDE